MPAFTQQSSEEHGPPASSPDHPSNQRTRVVVPRRPTVWQRLLAASFYAVERTLETTLRLRLEDPLGLLGAGLPAEPVIYCLWHNRLASAMIVFHKYVRRQDPRRRLAALVSASKDGSQLAAILERYDITPVRGSSSRRGVRALLELRAALAAGSDVAITPDGPRGPRYEIQDGVLALAQLAGAPILPVGIHSSRKWILPSWDRFQIPQPFATCRIRIGEFLRIEPTVGTTARGELNAELQRRMMALTSD